MRVLVAIPVYNEEKHVRSVLERVLREAGNVLVVDDGSTDCTSRLLADYPVDQIRHSVNRGYGRSIRDSFRWAMCEGYDWLITMDCDDQHEPASIPHFMETIDRVHASGEVDVLSGSRYLMASSQDDSPPADRRSINAEITRELNQRFGVLLGTKLTDAFCGFKAYRVEALGRLNPTVNGYAFPMQHWVQVAAARLVVQEIPVRLIYNDPNRSFGAVLDDPGVRLAHYRCVMHQEIRRQADRLPPSAVGELQSCG